MGIELEPSEHRRTVETRDVAPNHLGGRRFRVQALVHRGGLRPDVLEDGTVRSGDVVEPLE